MSNATRPSKVRSHIAPEQRAGLGYHINQAFTEASWICLLITAVFFCLSLGTYHSEDPQVWLSEPIQAPIHNLGGMLGALVSDFLLTLVGLAAYTLPMVLMYAAWRLIRVRPIVLGVDVLALGSIRLIGLMFVLIALAVLLVFFPQDPTLPQGNGGILGLQLFLKLKPILGVSGVGLIFTAMLMTALSLAFGISWLKCLERLGEWTWFCGQRVGGWLQNLPSQLAKQKPKPASSPNMRLSKTLAVAKRLRGFFQEKLIGFKRDQASYTQTTEEDNPNYESTHYNQRALKKESKQEKKVEDIDAPKLNKWKLGDWFESDETKHRSNRIEPSIADDDPLLEMDALTTEHLSQAHSDRPKEKVPKPIVQEKTETNKDPSNMPPVKLAPKIEPLQRKSTEPDVPVELPGLELLNSPCENSQQGYSESALQTMAELLEAKLRDFGVKVEVVAINPGPVITRFEIQPAPGVKASKITNLASDLARSLAMISVRVVEVIPGKSVMGIEVPNEQRQIVYLQSVLSSSEFAHSKSPLTLVLGHDIAGDPVTADLAKMPHLLVAGTTGSGKSVGVNAMLLSLLYKSRPDDVRLIMIDPKMLELSIYEGIPHLLAPVITDMKEAANGLRWCVAEMERRYRLMASLGVRNLVSYNQKVVNAQEKGEPILDPLWSFETALDPGAGAPPLEKLPYIVVVIDEFADMMMMVGKKVEELIARIAQKARAAGIHLILATQRPSVDVITGLIKANVPTRIAFQVSSKIDSRTILDQGGAEQLLGHGDMLFLPPGSALPIRVHGAFVADEEVHAVVANWKEQGEPDYLEITSGEEQPASLADLDAGDAEQDALFDEAVAFVTSSGKVSISSVQRKLRIGYNRAARLVEAMEESGVVSSPGHNGNREVLAAAPPEI